jgi:hypothetical protein
MKEEYDKDMERVRLRKGLKRAEIGMGRCKREKKEAGAAHTVIEYFEGLDPPPLTSWWER